MTDHKPSSRATSLFRPRAGRSPAAGECGENCQWKALYHGSQTSLAHMAERQADALNERKRLRGDIVKLMRRYFLSDFEDAERRSKGRMSDQADEVIVAWLDRMIAERISPFAQPAGRAGVEQLRAALVAHGYQLPDSDGLDEWAAAITPAAPAPATTAAPGESGGRTETASSGDMWDPDFSDDSWLTDTSSDWAETAVWEDADLADLFNDPDPTDNRPAPAAAAAEPSAAPTGADSGSADDVPNASGNEGGGDQQRDDDGRRTSDVIAAKAREAHADWFESDNTLDRLFAPPETTEFPGGLAAIAEQTDDLEELWADDSAELEELWADEQPADHNPAEPEQPPAQPAGSSHPQQHQTSAAEQQIGAHTANGKIQDRNPAAEASQPGNAAAAANPALTPALRPELISTRSRRGRGTRQPATKARRPDLAQLTQPAEELGSDTASALLATVAIPRPIFTSDLLAVARDEQTLAQWEEQMRRLGGEAPVRIIAAKRRHRLRGSLILPHGALRAQLNREGGSWWADAMDTYHGSRIYELAVLLHRVGGNIVSADLNANAASIRVNGQRGLTGLVVSMTTTLDAGTPTRDSVCDTIAQFISERLSLVAVLTVAEDSKGKVAQAILEEAEERKWAPTCPVVTATTWDWAEDSGRSAKLLLGG